GSLTIALLQGRLDGAQLIWVHDANSSFWDSEAHCLSFGLRESGATRGHLVRSGWRTGIPRLFHARLGAVHPLVRAVHPERAVVPAVRGGEDRAEGDRSCEREGPETEVVPERPQRALRARGRAQHEAAGDRERGRRP